MTNSKLDNDDIGIVSGEFILFKNRVWNIYNKDILPILKNKEQIKVLEYGVDNGLIVIEKIKNGSIRAKE